MAALTKGRDTPEIDAKTFSAPVAAGVVIYPGALVVLNASGNAEPATTATGKKGGGRAKMFVDNSAGSAGDVAVTYERGCFRYANDGNVTRAHIGGNAYAVDDQTVAPTDGTGTRSAVGVIRHLDALGVWVEF